MMPAPGYRCLPLAAETTRHRRGWSLLLAPERTVVKSSVPHLHIRGSAGCDCGGEVVVVGVESASPRGVVDRRVLTADVDEGLGTITCEKSGFDQMAKLYPPFGVAQGDLLIPVRGSAVGVDVVWNKKKEMSQVHQGAVDETCSEWMTSIMRKGATHPKLESTSP